MEYGKVEATGRSARTLGPTVQTGRGGLGAPNDKYLVVRTGGCLDGLLERRKGRSVRTGSKHLVGQSGPEVFSGKLNEDVLQVSKEVGGVLDSIWTVRIEEQGTMGVRAVRFCCMFAMSGCYSG